MDGHAYRHPRMRMLEIEEVGAHFRRPAIEKALDELVDGAAADVGYGLLGSERPTSDKGMPRPRYPLRKSARTGIDVT
jgi:hypothetical protein